MCLLISTLQKLGHKLPRDWMPPPETASLKHDVCDCPHLQPLRTKRTSLWATSEYKVPLLLISFSGCSGLRSSPSSQALPKILRSVPRWVQHRQHMQQQQQQHVQVLCGAQVLGVICGHCMQERPCCVFEGTCIWRAVCALWRCFGSGSSSSGCDGCCCR
jgi:hypothetical protein